MSEAEIVIIYMCLLRAQQMLMMPIVTLQSLKIPRGQHLLMKAYVTLQSLKIPRGQQVVMKLFSRGR